MFEKPRARTTVVAATLAALMTGSACSSGGKAPPEQTPQAPTPSFYIPPAIHVACTAQKLETWAPLAKSMDTELMAQVLRVDKSRVDAGQSGPVHCEQPIDSDDVIRAPIIATVHGLGAKALSNECALMKIEGRADANGNFHVITHDVEVACPSNAV